MIYDTHFCHSNIRPQFDNVQRLLIIVTSSIRWQCSLRFGSS